MIRLLAILVVTTALSFAGPPQAQAQYNSYGTSGGYTQRDGYWWNSQGVAHTRTKATRRAKIGCCWQNVAYWQYTAVRIDPYQDNALEKLLDIAANRDRIEGRLRVENNRHNTFLEKLEALGMKGNFSWDGYGYQMQTARGAGFGSQAYNYQPYAKQGNTVYGYNSFKTPYGDVDMSLAMKQASDLAQNAQQLAGSGHQQYMEYLQEMSDGQSRVAEIMAKAELLKAAEPKPGPKQTRSFTFRATTAPNGQLQVEQLKSNATAANTDKLHLVLQKNCLQCHGADKQSGNVDLRQFLSFSYEQKVRVADVITTADLSRRMPKASSGTGAAVAGHPLTPDEILTITHFVK